MTSLKIIFKAGETFLFQFLYSGRKVTTFRLK